MPIVDPSSLGYQGFGNPKILKEVLSLKLLNNYKEKWGMDYMVLIAAFKILQIPFNIVNVQGFNYFPERRTKEKVDNKYRMYRQIINEFLKYSPTQN